jgi:GntR family transcriptional regulator / MocR family aminotransferase
MYLELDEQGPRYAQLLRALKSAILGGRYPAGAKLPATRVLARQLELSRNTVLAAYEQLRAEGFIEGRVGSGCYVAEIAQAPSAPPKRRTRPAAPLSRRGQRGQDMYDRNIPGRQHKGVRYNLQYGLPVTNPALSSAWRRELHYAAARAELDYPNPQGVIALRESVCDYLKRRRGIVAAAEDVMIVTGTQQAIAFAADVLLDEGDTAVVEDPNYQGARQALLAQGAHLLSCRVDDDGLVASELPTGAAVKLLVVTPSHQFPTGSVLTLPRRMELLAYADAQRCFVVEDDYDGEFRYDARPLAALKSLDSNERVIYIGSFSKVIFPSLRLGYMVLPPSLRNAFVAAKWLNDRGCPAIEQAALARLISTGAFERHLRQTSLALKARRAALLAGIKRHTGNHVQLADSGAGMHVVAWLPRLTHAQVERLIENARARGLGLYSINPYYMRKPSRPGLMLGYADLPPADLEAAMALLGRCLRELSDA